MRILPFKSLGMLALAALIVPLFTSATLSQQPSAEALQQVRTQSLISQSDIIKRAQSWVTAKVPYDQRQLYNGYREDCSGLVSAAWGLKTPGNTTYNLPSVAYPIKKDQLAPGDILNNRDGDGNEYDAHVLIFAGWANASHTQYNAYEENPYWNGAHYTTNIPYPFWPGHSQSYVPMRYKNLGGAAPSPAPATQDWKNRQYSLTCDNIVRAPVGIAFHDGLATAAGTDIGNYDHWNLHIEQIVNGVLPSLGAVTAVLFYCTPQPSNFFNQELHVYRTGDGSEIGRIPDLQSSGSGSTGSLPGVFKAGSIVIKNGQVAADAMFYGPGDSHASGPSILRHLAWTWNGQEFITIAATPSQPTPACPSVTSEYAVPIGPGCRKPTTLYFSGDQTVSIRGITWTSWNASGATGTGTWYLVDCSPNCAQGPITKYPATLTLSNVQNGLFTTLTTTRDGQTSTWNYPANWPQHT